MKAGAFELDLDTGADDSLECFGMFIATKGVVQEDCAGEAEELDRGAIHADSCL